MSVPQYFVPDVSRSDAVDGDRLSADFLRKVGLLDVFDDVLDLRTAAVMAIENSGPAGPGGHHRGIVLCAWNHTPPRIGVQADQTWHPVKGQPFLIGLENDRPVDPKELARRRQISGHKVTLKDLRWLVPLYRIPRQGPHGTGLPTDLYYEGDEFVQAVHAEHYQRWEDSAVVFDTMLQGEGTFDFRWIHDYCVDALSANYRYSRHLQAVLKLFDGVTWEDIAQATIDWPTVLDRLREKKTEHTSRG